VAEEAEMSAFPKPTPPAASPTPPRNWRPFVILVGLISVPLLVLDQVSKYYVEHHMFLYQTIPVVPHLFDITYTQNPGAAFSMFATLPAQFRVLFLVALSSTAIVVLLVLLAQSRKITLLSLSFALILAGASGNLCDRAFRGGRVIDFLRLHYYALSYPVFNVADSAISIGVVLVILATLITRNESD
jgi:signal peptidase II